MGGADPALPELDLQCDSALAALSAVNTAPLSVNTSAGIPHRSNAARKVSTTCGPKVMQRAFAAILTRE
jgi:hypothetical protein